MQKAEYQNLEYFFESYTGRFVEQADDPEPFNLKIVHTSKVCKNMQILAQSQGWTGEKRNKALAAARLHDIGRFFQYQKYGTFSDARSENHAALGLKVIKEQGILKNLEKREQRQIQSAVSLHNAFGLPAGLDKETRELAELVRDADKLDIYRVMIALYKGISPGRTSFITHHLPDDGRLSENLVENIENRKLVALGDVKTLNDMKFLQISWIFDLNFKVSLELIQQRAYIPTILSTMVQSAMLDRVSSAAADYINETIKLKIDR